jgi:hypothetical protein
VTIWAKAALPNSQGIIATKKSEYGRQADENFGFALIKFKVAELISTNSNAKTSSHNEL